MYTQKISGDYKNTLVVHSLFDDISSETIADVGTFQDSSGNVSSPIRHEILPMFPTVPGYWKIVSIDPGSRNYALRVFILRGNRRETLAFVKFALEPKSSKHTAKKQVDDIENVSKKVQNSRVGQKKDKKAVYSQAIYTSLNKHLEALSPTFRGVNFVFVEKQLPFNLKATRIMQATIDFFLSRCIGTECIIVEVDPIIKSEVLGFDKGAGKQRLKAASVVKALEILAKHNDQDSIDVINSLRKKDDLADTVCMAESMIIKWRLEDW